MKPAGGPLNPRSSKTHPVAWDFHLTTHHSPRPISPSCQDRTSPMSVVTRSSGGRVRAAMRPGGDGVSKRQPITTSGPAGRDPRPQSSEPTLLRSLEPGSCAESWPGRKRTGGPAPARCLSTVSTPLASPKKGTGPVTLEVPSPFWDRSAQLRRRIT